MAISRIEDAIDSIRRRKMTVLVDNEDRENEGDIMVAADAATTPDIALRTPAVELPGRVICAQRLLSPQCGRLTVCS
ncbi:3,4-dihydroxy-2-butanone-4-phosphate synthase (plasmid) [Rhizobium ruizarguesonis]|uniref:3,4-dihydroxy-2-butanone-4-phosphate synthase n=1 Tax=Rhizobium ruizarguesonis TaxID=2081791 RepID=A0ACD5EX03_9HYPH|nr:3,4-dihydroxy-2-butanone-4-phosphate synthase [Rhizobium leguminosarum]